MNHFINKDVNLIDLGLINYQDAWDFQTKLFDQIVQLKLENRTLAPEQQKQTPNYLIFCEHPHVFTLGKSGQEKNLLVKEDQLRDIGARYYHINRGGDITYHGPGQIVVYPILDLENFFADIHRYMRLLEESVIQTLEAEGVSAGRLQGLTGVWLDSDNPILARKICALGVKTSRWVTLHGLAFNVNSNLKYFEYIVPCGIGDKAVTSLEKEKGKPQDIVRIKSTLQQKIAGVFDMKLSAESTQLHQK